MRYGLPLKEVPSHCPCGSTFGIDHALIYPKGGFPTSRHNEVRDITADLLSEICSDVAVEPHFYPFLEKVFSGVVQILMMKHD